MHFAWILGAIQDVWCVPPREETAPTGVSIFGYGTTLRFFDPSIGAWRSPWHGVIKNEVIPFIGRAVGSEIQ